MAGWFCGGQSTGVACGLGGCVGGRRGVRCELGLGRLIERKKKKTGKRE